MRAEEIARALEGRKLDSGWMARCPAHRAVQLCNPIDVLMISEGIENALSTILQELIARHGFTVR
jgi:hypothetical protein